MKVVSKRCFSFFTVLVFAAVSFAASDPTTIDEFNAAQVISPQMEARCQNFADAGAQYVFKIVNGKIFYSRNGEFLHEFSTVSGSAAFVNLTQQKKYSGTQCYLMTEPAPAFDMISARNNRVLVKESNSTRLYWAALTQEYKNEPHADSSTHDNVDACYTKIDPQYGVAGAPERSWYGGQTDGPNPSPNPTNNHYSTQAYVNDKPIELPDAMKSLASNITLDGNMPDAKEVATTQYIKTQTMPVGPAMPDLMQVQVQAGRWYLIDATPPRNFLNGGKAVLAGTGPLSYDARKRKIFKDMSGIMAKVGTEILNRGGNDEKLRTVLKDKVTDEASKIFAPVEAIGVGVGLIVITGGLAGVIATSTAVTWNAAVVVTRNDIISHISTMNFKPLVDDAETFFNDNIDYALDNNNFLNTSQIDNLLNTKISLTTDDLKASLFTHVFKSDWNNDIRYDPFENALKAKIAEMANGISTSLVKFNTGQMLGFATSYLPNSYLQWNVMARNINRWSNEFTYQGDRYQMKDVSVGADYTKTVLDIQDIIGIGIASTSRYQHYRKEYGGELAAWYGDVSNPENWDMGIGSNPNPENWQDLIDGHGYVDGTTNFYMLAKVGIKKTPTDANFTQQYAALWLDEQEYFSERWRIIHPLDNAFEGLAGTITAAYPVMAWFNGISLLSLASEYGTPYENLTSNARMATAGTATVIADDDKIYSATYYYSLTDRTWRWRAYPKLAAGATINKQSVKMREDLTIYFEGSKIVNGTPIAGYWYQSYLGSNSLKDQGTPQVGGMPQTGFTLKWNFMGKAAFDAADKNFFKFGVYETDKTTATNVTRDQHYGYKGYTPRTHVFALSAGLRISAPNGSLITPTDFVNAKFDNNNEYILCHSATTVPSYYTTAEKKWDAENGYPTFSKMYKDLDISKRPLVKIKFIKVPNSPFVCAYYVDPRNDDVKLLAWTPFILGAPPVNLMPASDWPLALANKRKIGIPQIYPGLNIMGPSQSGIMTDLNVWADIPLNTVSVVKENAAQSCQFSYTVSPPKSDNYSPNYVPLNLKIGYFTDGGIPQILKSIALDYAGSLTGNFTINNLGLTQAEWNEYFSEEGKISHGTSIWVEDAFGNSNAFADIAITGKTSGPVMGFEDYTKWSMLYSSGVLSNSTIKTEGNKSLQITGNGWQQIISTAINTTDMTFSTGDKLAFDFFVGNTQSNPYWIGQVQLYINCPSANIYNQYIGFVELTGLPFDQFKTMSFTLPPNVVKAITESHADFAFSLCLNTNPGSGPYYFDNMRFEQ